MMITATWMMMMMQNYALVASNLLEVRLAQATWTRKSWQPEGVKSHAQI